VRPPWKCHALGMSRSSGKTPRGFLPSVSRWRVFVFPCEDGGPDPGPISSLSRVSIRHLSGLPLASLVSPHRSPFFFWPLKPALAGPPWSIESEAAREFVPLHPSFGPLPGLFRVYLQSLNQVLGLFVLRTKDVITPSKTTARAFPQLPEVFPPGDERRSLLVQ